jgi:hypothetical protein
MKTDTYTKSVLTCIALCLVILVIEQWNGRRATAVYAAPVAPQQWEYKYLAEDLLKWSDDGNSIEPGDTIDVDGVTAPRNTVNQVWASLGLQGWELVTCTSRQELYQRFVNFAVANSSSSSLDGKIYGDLGNGVTSKDMCTFKRPKH